MPRIASKGKVLDAASLSSDEDVGKGGVEVGVQARFVSNPFALFSLSLSLSFSFAQLCEETVNVWVEVVDESA